MAEAVRPRGVVVALVVAGAVALFPVEGLSLSGRYALATMAFAGTLWVTGALPLALTALLVPVGLVGLGVYDDFGDAVAGFADPVVFLLLAGFVLAEAMSARGLDRRVAFRVLTVVGRSPRRLVLGVMVATAALSMVVSNTATVAMMVPIVLGLVTQVTGRRASAGGPGAAATDGGTALEAHPAPNLRASLLLGTANAASVGGVGTLIGTPPNAIVVSQLGALAGVEMTFVQWLGTGLPIVAVTLPLT